MVLGRYDYLPIDSEAYRHVARKYHGGESAPPRQIEAVDDQWDSWKYLVYWFDMAGG